VCTLCLCTAANLEQPKFIPGRYRRDLSSQPSRVTTDSSIHTTSADDGRYIGLGKIAIKITHYK